MADYVYILDRGRISFAGEPGEISGGDNHEQLPRIVGVMRAPRWARRPHRYSAPSAPRPWSVGLPGSASADDTRYNLEARGDAFYFEVNGDEIPASPKNDAGSADRGGRDHQLRWQQGLCRACRTSATPCRPCPAPSTASRTSSARASSRSRSRVLPGLRPDGVLRAPRRPSRTSATAGSSPPARRPPPPPRPPTGAPAQIPAPNQQQTANASTESKGNAVSAVGLRQLGRLRHRSARGR